MKRVAFLTALLLGALTTNAATTVILVRHADKAHVSGDDVPLSETGEARARELARVLADAGVDAIYTTQFRRTRDTAAPLAAAMKIAPRVIESGKEYPASVVRAVLAKHRGETVLVVGHSNSTVNVLRELGMSDPPKIEEPQFDHLFVCTIGVELPASCVALRYGAPTR